MDDHPHFIIANRLWDAIARGDARALRALMSDKTVWRMCGRSPLAGDYLGPDAILDFLARIGDLTDDLRSDLIDVFVSDRGAALRYGIHAVRGTRALETEHLFLIHVAGGRIAEAVFAPVDQYGYDQFFSPN